MLLFSISWCSLHDDVCVAFNIIADIDECQLDSPAFPCNAYSEYCTNSIGGYTCTCKEDFTLTCINYDGKHIDLPIKELSIESGVKLLIILLPVQHRLGKYCWMLN